ncbi:MAG: hypothetical protein KBF73_12850 [Flavobacteriales bacterium]|nr:hypothetical protein [Flavobacteriales bacterium]
MKDISLRDRYLSEVGWIILDPILFNAITVGLLNKQILRKRVIENLSIKEAAKFFNLSLTRVEELEIAALAELKSNVSLSVLVANRLDSSTSTSKSTQIPLEARLSDVKGIPPRIVNLLDRNGIYTVDDLLQYNREELLEIQGLGSHSIAVLADTFNRAGMKTELEKDPSRRRGVAPKRQNVQLASERPQSKKAMDASKALISLKTPLSRLRTIEVRVLNTFRMNDIHTVEDALKYDRQQLLKFRGFGSKTVTDLSKVFSIVGIITDWDQDPLLYRSGED